MTELFDDDDLFAARPAAQPPRQSVGRSLFERMSEATREPVAAPPPPPTALPPRRTRRVEEPPKVKPPRDPRLKPNPGRCPDEARGKRVVVELANGRICGEEPVSPVTPAGWAADGTPNRPGCRWTLTGAPHDIAFYRVL